MLQWLQTYSHSLRNKYTVFNERERETKIISVLFDGYVKHEFKEYPFMN